MDNKKNNLLSPEKQSGTQGYASGEKKATGMKTKSDCHCGDKTCTCCAEKNTRSNSGKKEEKKW